MFKNTYLNTLDTKAAAHFRLGIWRQRFIQYYQAISYKRRKETLKYFQLYKTVINLLTDISKLSPNKNHDGIFIFEQFIELKKNL